MPYYEELIQLLGSLKETDTSISLGGHHLKGQTIDDKGATALAEALKTNTTLKSINLKNNAIRDAGAIALAEALKTNIHVTSIRLFNNQIGDKGAIALAEALKTNNSLTEISLIFNDIGDTGTKALIEALKTNTRLRMLDVDHEVSDDSRKKIGSLLARNRLLQQMPFTYTKVEGGRNYPPISPFYSAKKLPDNMNPIEFSYSEIKKLYTTLIDLQREMDRASDFVEPEEMKLVKARYWENTACFHLKCLDKHSDITEPHPNIIAANIALAQIPKDSDSYKAVCLHLGNYYVNRMHLAGSQDSESQKAFAKSAINYFKICLSDEEFCQKNEVASELTDLIPAAVLTVTGEDIPFGQSIQGIIKDAAWKKAVETTVVNEAMPLTQPSMVTNDKLLTTSLQNAALSHITRFLDEEINQLKNLQKSVTASNSQLFSAPSSPFTKPSNQELISAYDIIKGAYHGEKVNPDILKQQISLFDRAGKSRDLFNFMQLCTPICINGREVETFPELVSVLMNETYINPKPK